MRAAVGAAWDAHSAYGAVLGIWAVPQKHGCRSARYAAKKGDPMRYRDMTPEARAHDTEIHRRWRREHREQYNSYHRAYYAAHREEIRARLRQYRAQKKSAMEAADDPV